MAGRSRSEYLCTSIRTPASDDTSNAGVRLAVEGVPEARDAADHFLARRVADCSVVVETDGRLVAMSFVSVVDGRAYIDPVATASAWKRRGLGRRAVVASLQRLGQAGVDEVGATITDGNVASEQPFASLGFVRVGAWGQRSSSSSGSGG